MVFPIFPIITLGAAVAAVIAFRKTSSRIKEQEPVTPAVEPTPIVKPIEKNGSKHKFDPKSWFRKNGLFLESSINFGIAKKLGWPENSDIDFKVEKIDWSKVSEEILENLKPELEKTQENNTKKFQNSCNHSKKKSLKEIENLLSNCDAERKGLLEDKIKILLKIELLYNDYSENNMDSLFSDIINLLEKYECFFINYSNFLKNFLFFNFKRNSPDDAPDYNSRFSIIYAYYLILERLCDLLKPEGKFHKFIKEIVNNYDFNYTSLGCCLYRDCLSRKKFEERLNDSGNKDYKTKWSFETKDGANRFIKETFKDKAYRYESYKCPYGEWYHIRTVKTKKKNEAKPLISKKEILKRSRLS